MVMLPPPMWINAAITSRINIIRMMINATMMYGLYLFRNNTHAGVSSILLSLTGLLIFGSSFGCILKLLLQGLCWWFFRLLLLFLMLRWIHRVNRFCLHGFPSYHVTLWYVGIRLCWFYCVGTGFQLSFCITFIRIDLTTPETVIAVVVAFIFECS